MGATGRENVGGHREGVWVEAPKALLGQVAMEGEGNGGIPVLPTGRQGQFHGHGRKFSGPTVDPGRLGMARHSLPCIKPTSFVQLN